MKHAFYSPFSRKNFKTFFRISALLLGTSTIGLSGMAAVSQNSSATESISEKSPLSDLECGIIKVLDEKYSIIKKLGGTDFSIELVWYVHENQPTGELKKKLDTWFQHPAIEKAMNWWYQPATKGQDSAGYDKSFGPIARELGFSNPPYYGITVSPDNAWIFKNCSAFESIGRVITRNAMQKIVDEHRLAIKLPQKFLYIEPNAAKRANIIVVAQKFNLQEALPSNQASHDLQKQLDFFEEQCKKNSIGLDWMGDNITFHRDNNHPLGGYIAIIDTEGGNFTTNAPQHVKQYYYEWIKKQSS